MGPWTRLSHELQAHSMGKEQLEERITELQQQSEEQAACAIYKQELARREQQQKERTHE